MRRWTDHIEFLIIGIVVAVILAIAVAACGEEELPDNCFRDDGEVVCVNQGGDDDRDYDDDED